VTTATLPKSRPFPFSEVLADRVRKRRPAALIAVEAEKTARAAAIGAATGLFRVPSVLTADPALGILETECFDDLVQLHDVLLQDENADASIAAAGRSLAAIHERLVLPASMRVSLPAPYAAPELGVDVALHGDFNTLNLFLRGGNGELVITDWETSYQAHRLTDPAPDEVPTVGPRYFDLAWFVGSLFRRTWFGLRRVPRAWDRAELFLCSYFVAAGPEARPEAFASYLAEFALRRSRTDASSVSRLYWLRHPRSLITWYGAVEAFARSLAASTPERRWNQLPGGERGL
jgi:hypothetical protein